MTTLPNRIRQRIAATGKSLRQVSLDGGLSQDTLSKILRMPGNSPTLETVRKLALGLETTPEWLAYGVEPSRSEAVATCAVSEAGSPQPSRNVPVPHTNYIQVSADVLRRLVSGALQNESILEAEADEYANAVLESIEARAVVHVVHRIEASDHTPPGSPAPGQHDRS